MNKETRLVLESSGAYESMNMVSQRLASSHTENDTFLNLTFDVQPAHSPCCKLACCLTSPPASLEQFSQSYGDAFTWAQIHKHPHQIKWLSISRLWLYLLVGTLLCCSLPRRPFLIKSRIVSMYVSADNLFYKYWIKSPVLGPGMGFPFLQHLFNNFHVKFGLYGGGSGGK